jgi:branched-chain amino acid transport system ATP-binding protein
MDVAQSERRALIGPNGAGKTTLFNVIAGDLPATSGRITLFDKDITHMPVHERVMLGLRRTYQTSALFNALTVAENLYLGVAGPSRSHFNMVRLATRDRERMFRVHEIAEAVGLTDRLSTVAGHLSHGERRQLEFGLAVAWEPRMVMLDEPAAGLSQDERKVVVKLLNALPRQMTLLLIEHDMDIALSVAERVTVLHEGRIIAEGSPTEVTSNAQVQRVYLGGELHD